MSKERLDYTGEKNSKALDAFCKKNSFGCYVVCRTGFATAFVYKHDKLPRTNYAPSDYPEGYYHDGKLVPWSKARTIAAQNAGQNRD